jgi:hypothetical protein
MGKGIAVVIMDILSDLELIAFHDELAVTIEFAHDLVSLVGTLILMQL